MVSPININKLDRYKGAMIGLACGDALGTTLEFRRPGTFEPIGDIVGDGLFELKAGKWTDDTSQALCLAQSLIECKVFNPSNQLEKYLKWYEEGYLSSTGECFDIGNTTVNSLAEFKSTKRPFCTSKFSSPSNGSLMRLAPVPLFYLNDPEKAIYYADLSSQTTHGAIESRDACRYLAALIVGAVNGASKEELTSSHYSSLKDYWEKNPLCKAINEVAEGSYKTKEPPQIRGVGYVPKSLEAALWAFNKSSNFKDGALLAVNLGEDADTTGAIYGQLAGSYYGESGIPKGWLGKIYNKGLIEKFATELYELSNSSTL